MGRETKSRSKSTKSTKTAALAVKSKTKTPKRNSAALEAPKKRSFFTRKSLGNPFLNFLRDFRKEMKDNGLPPRKLVSLGAQRWRDMNPSDRAAYIKEAENARKRRRKEGLMKKGGGCNIPQLRKYGNNTCPECGHAMFEDQKQLSRDPSTTATTATTRTSRSPSESNEDISEVSESCSAADSRSSLD